MPKLNPEQQKAVTTIETPLLVIAGAGSGKTRVITEKISYLINKGVEAKYITALTFTNKSAGEMRSRVDRLCSSKKAKGIRISTFHSLGFDIIRKEYQTLGFKKNISILDEQDKVKTLQDILENNKRPLDKAQIASFSWQISDWKSKAILPAQAMSISEDQQQQFAAALYKQYQQYNRICNAVDFDDLIIIPLTLFKEHSLVLEKWQNNTRYLLLDEYQDTNTTQYELFKQLVGSVGQFTVVGDDDQSIYAWRGANPENLFTLKNDFPRLEIIKLEQNYRSNQRILKAANQLISNNPHLYEKNLWSNIKSDNKINVIQCKDEFAEAQQIAAEISCAKFKRQASNADFAILYRSNHQARLLERSLRELSLPYAISGGTSFFSHTEIKDILCYIKLLINPDDNNAFLRVVNTPRREIGTTTIEKLAHYANERHISLFDACFEIGLEQQLNERTYRKLRSFCDWIVSLSDRTQHTDSIALLHEMVEHIDYYDWIKTHANSDKQAERKINNVLELIKWIENSAKKSQGKRSLGDIVSRMLLFDSLERNEAKEKTDQIKLMTLHAAKGLEFSYVYLIGMEEGVLPHQNSIDDEQIEEERRLAYVGITRAQKQLTFSYCSQRKKYGDVTSTEPSRFLTELPIEDLNWAAVNKQDPEEQKKKGQANLALMRRLLKTS
ncbi:MAG: ATP-dependent DNA helicase Rep [Cycloclasticus sp. symbiont of Poecilosclerida sp. N]|nr:MAG: ATP-dependent DNA helicase Rep [Cycloclasticus sp. symbiont of Poecilosclerida sp. N]